MPHYAKVAEIYCAASAGSGRALRTPAESASQRAASNSKFDRENPHAVPAQVALANPSTEYQPWTSDLADDLFESDPPYLELQDTITPSVTIATSTHNELEWNEALFGGQRRTSRRFCVVCTKEVGWLRPHRMSLSTPFVSCPHCGLQQRDNASGTHHTAHVVQSSPRYSRHDTRNVQKWWMDSGRPASVRILDASSSPVLDAKQICSGTAHLNEPGQEAVKKSRFNDNNIDRNCSDCGIMGL
jgi:hypothetical protein